MIGWLKGKVAHGEEDHLILDVNGVGYEIFCAPRLIAGLSRDVVVELVIETYLREDHLQLFGFASREERNWFRLLQSVPGIGARMALAILGLYAPSELARIIAARDHKSLTRVSGVGGKLAERLVSELKDKAAKMPSSAGPPLSGKAALPPSSLEEDALSALLHLGYSRTDAWIAVTKIAQEEKDLSALIAKALQSLAMKT
jgi:Holliday junction DNA helicase RuvA